LLDEADSVGYDPETNTYHVAVRWTDVDSVPRVVVEVVAAVVGRDPDAMDPLHSVADPEALAAIVGPSDGGTDDGDGDGDGGGDARLSFWYEGCLVTVATDGVVAVQPER
jgi:hypothetical protein